MRLYLGLFTEYEEIIHNLRTKKVINKLADVFKITVTVIPQKTTETWRIMQSES